MSIFTYTNYVKHSAICILNVEQDTECVVYIYSNRYVYTDYKVIKKATVFEINNKIIKKNEREEIN